MIFLAGSEGEAPGEAKPAEQLLHAPGHPLRRAQAECGLAGAVPGATLRTPIAAQAQPDQPREYQQRTGRRCLAMGVAPHEQGGRCCSARGTTAWACCSTGLPSDELCLLDSRTDPHRGDVLREGVEPHGSPSRSIRSRALCRPCSSAAIRVRVFVCSASTVESRTWRDTTSMRRRRNATSGGRFRWRRSR